jgi:hypothetical protein
VAEDTPAPALQPPLPGQPRPPKFGCALALEILAHTGLMQYEEIFMWGLLLLLPRIIWKPKITLFYRCHFLFHRCSP